MAGIGNTFSLMINDWAGGNLFIAIILIGLASLVLGMGLPVTASYIVLATLSAPALYTMISDGMLIKILVSGDIPDTAKTMLALANPDFLTSAVNLDAAQAKALLAELPLELSQLVKDQLVSPELITGALLSAHMIIFWLSQDSNVTPPVCLTAFTAAAIAKSPPMATGLPVLENSKRTLPVTPGVCLYAFFIRQSFREEADYFCCLDHCYLSSGLAVTKDIQKINCIDTLLYAYPLICVYSTPISAGIFAQAAHRGWMFYLNAGIRIATETNQMLNGLNNKGSNCAE